MHLVEHRPATAVGHVHVEQHDVRRVGGDTHNRLPDGPGLAHHLDALVAEAGELGLDPCAKQRMVVDEEHRDGAARYGARGCRCRGRRRTWRRSRRR